MKLSKTFAFLLILIISCPSLSFGKELPKIAVWDLEARNTPATHAKELTSILVSEIAQSQKYEAFSQDNVRTLAGFTAERMMLGCTDSKCLTALGQMDIAKLISGSVAKIGNVYSISLNLFDTQNTKAENAISEFCRTEEELILMVQRGVRKLLGLPVDASASFILPPPPPPAAPAAAPSGGTASLEINTKVRGAQVLLNGQNMGEAPVRVFNLNSGSHEIQVSKKGYGDHKERIQIQPNERKVIEANLKRLMLDEDYLVDKVFYFENCSFGWDKFNYVIRFQKQGRLEGAPRSGSVAKLSKDSLDLGSLNGRWVLDKNKMIIDFQMLRGISQRRVMKVEVDLGPDREDVFPTKCETSTEYRLAGRGQSQVWDGLTEIVNCQMKELR